MKEAGVERLRNDADQQANENRAPKPETEELDNNDRRSDENGRDSRYSREGYHSSGRSANLFGKDRSTRRTINLAEWRGSISKSDIHNEMRLFWGNDYVKVDNGKWRSLDGTRQFRVKPDDYLGNHGSSK